jgi:hypothetical protein
MRDRGEDNDMTPAESPESDSHHSNAPMLILDIAFSNRL